MARSRPPGPAVFSYTGWRLFAVVVVLFFVPTAMSASAFSAASMPRDSGMDVVADDAGPIALVDGTSGPIVSQTPRGTLSIDFTRAGSATGVNVNARYTLGDPGDPTNAMAFDVVNRDGDPHDVTVSYAIAETANDPDADANVAFKLYDATGTHRGTVSEESGPETVRLDADERYHVVVVIDTHGLDPSADLSGTLSVTAT